jgi:chromate transport protein ChrA
MRKIWFDWLPDKAFITLMFAGLVITLPPAFIIVGVLSLFMEVPWFPLFNSYLIIWVVVCLVLIERGWG